MKILTELNEEIFKIKNSDNAYISKEGNIYIKTSKGFFIKKQYMTHGYMYVKLLYNGKMHSKRMHRLLAETFIPNPNNYPVVGHKNNIKNDNRLENLYWTTISENTQKAFDDGLAKNAKGYEDSQSCPVYVCDFNWNIIDEYGSVGECARAFKISKSTVARQVAQPPEKRHKTKSELYFIKQSDYERVKPIIKRGTKIVAVNIKTNEEIFFNSIAECEKALNVTAPTIARHLKDKPTKNRCGYTFYFSNDYRKA